MLSVRQLNPTLEEAAETVGRLVGEFEAHADYYMSPSYQEAEARKDFIDKFLLALGWDVNHDVQKNPFEQEVKVERSVPMVATAQRRADYSLSIAPQFGSPVLYIEAKKPHIEVATADNYFQTIRYANQRAHPIGVLTDFEQFHIIDCRFQANIDTALDRSLKRLHYSDYLDKERFAELFFLFSRPAIYGGSIDKYARTLPSPKGRPGQRSLFSLAFKTPDERLLQTLDELRESIARSLKLRNSSLDSGTLTELTQRIIDRLVFIRFLEDKLIEPDPIIPRLGEGENSAWDDFLILSRRLDRVYNGIVFKHHELMDEQGLLQVDNKVFCDVLDAFDYHKSTYLFADIPIDILGSIYERFLGNVIVATEKRASLELKPEVRKAGGVFYTPKYIVESIVESTVGTLIEGKEPSDIARLHFADISCGSGSFLLGIYDFLLKYVTRWYNEHPTRAPKDAVVRRDGVLYLSLSEKSRILTNNIFGVDIDHQAVEVAQLSLYLKLLESETTATARQYTLEFHRPLLPSLASNIKCGNSLIGTEFYDSRLAGLMAEGEEHGINAFDWKTEFRDVIGRGGFDVIVGNPPYIRIQTLSDTTPEQARFLRESYETAKKGNCDIYVLFIERALELLSKTGKAGFILPNKWLSTDYGSGLRKLLGQRRAVERIVDFKDGQVFLNATTYTCLLFLNGSETEAIAYDVLNDPKTIVRPRPLARSFGWGNLSDTAWSFESDQSAAILLKMRTAGQSLMEIGVDIARGSSSGADPVFTLRITDNGLATLDGAPVDIEEGILRTPIYAGNIRRHSFVPTTDNARIIFPYHVESSGYSGMSLGHLKQRFPAAHQYLLLQKSKLTSRKQFAEWWLFSAPRSLSVHDQADLLVPLLANKGLFCRMPQPQQHYCLMASGGFSISVAGSSLHPNYLLGLLNSKLIFWFLRRTSNIFRGGWITCTKQYVGKIPVIDPRRSELNKLYDEMVSIGGKIVQLREQSLLLTMDHAKTVTERRIMMAEDRVDQIVYELYGLSSEEILSVEATGSLSA